MVPFMPWACSDRLPVRPLAFLAAASLLFEPGAARANGWLAGVFPVVSFSGYTSGYGMRFHPIAAEQRHHDGIDIAAPLGSPIRSWWGGTVVEVIATGGCGHGLVIRSGNYEHVYCHLAGQSDGRTYRSGPVQLSLGQRVARGQQIGHVGLSGSTTGPHLHWGIRYKGETLDPARILQAMATSRRHVAPQVARSNVRWFR